MAQRWCPITSVADHKRRSAGAQARSTNERQTNGTNGTQTDAQVDRLRTRMRGLRQWRARISDRSRYSLYGTAVNEFRDIGIRKAVLNA